VDFLPGIPGNSHPLTLNLHPLNFGGYYLPLILLRDPLLRGLGISARVELVLYAVNNRDPRQAEWRAGATRIPPA
jgi:hypothetical protein